MQESDEQLAVLEKKLGSCVEKSKPYYEARIVLHESKTKYQKARNRFETAQELYVAAKNMQMYAEENLENFVFTIKQARSGSNSLDKDSLLKMLDIAKIKVNDTELSKQSSDAEQIEAYRVYDEKRLLVEQSEKELRKFVDKSRKYYELKSKFYKELRFLFTKIEGLKSCLKEAKQCYQQSLRNLETISTEIHIRRKSILLVGDANLAYSESDNKNTEKLVANDNSTSTTSSEQNTSNEETDEKKKSTSMSTLSSNSLSSLAKIENVEVEEERETAVTYSSQSQNKLEINNPTVETDKSNEIEEEALQAQHDLVKQEDFDVYFKQDLEKKMKTEIEIKPSFVAKLVNSVNSNNLMMTEISEEEIEHLKLEDKLKMYMQTLIKKKTEDLAVPVPSTTVSETEATASTKTSSDSATDQSTNGSNTSRPQFRVPSFWSNLNKKN